MAELTSRAKDMALALMFADAVIGLTRESKEIDDGGYERQPMNPTDPQGELRGMRAVRNATEIVFGPWHEDAPGEITGWIVIGASGVMATGEFERQRFPQRGDELFMREGEALIGLR